VSDTPGFFIDPETSLVGEHYAVVYVLQRRRSRFQANCVTLQDSEAAARAHADPARHLHAAKVVGPSKSSEGFMMYYLVRWIE
jgi:hypothetical protein